MNIKRLLAFLVLSVLPLCASAGPAPKVTIKSEVAAPVILENTQEKNYLKISLVGYPLCLYRHKNEVVTRDMLFDAAWGYDFLPNSRTLDQHISKLRKIIEPNPASPTLIRTVHGMGYRYGSAE